MALGKISCRCCNDPVCDGCNIYTLEQMLFNGAFDGMRGEQKEVIPAADVRPAVRGRWKRVDPRSTVVTFRCSECNYYAHVNATNFCPNCGADMRPSEEPENLTYIPPEKRSEVDDG